VRPISASGAAAQFDGDAIWRVIEPVFRAGETYPLPRDISRAFVYWRASGNEVFVTEDGGRIVGTYYLRANNRGGGSHVANCGYIVAANASRRRVARAMCVHSLERARGRGFTAMQFNFAISSNERAVKLWQDCGFIARTPLIMRIELDDSLKNHADRVEPTQWRVGDMRLRRQPLTKLAKALDDPSSPGLC
jgi:hypothetical protein